jgi:hypothetical protein
MKLKIISDGTYLGTKVVNAATGEAIENVTSIRWDVDWRNGIAEAAIEFRFIGVEFHVWQDDEEAKPL